VGHGEESAVLRRSTASHLPDKPLQAVFQTRRVERNLDRQPNDTFGQFLMVPHGNAPWLSVALRYLRDLK
jgi:hypothetical protein